MLENARSVAWILLAMLAVAPAVAAGGGLEDRVPEPTDVNETAEDAAEQAPDAPTPDPLPKPEDALPTSGDLPEPEDLPLAEARRVVRDTRERADDAATAALEQVNRVVPANPVGFVEDQLRPVRESAEEAQRIVLGEATSEEQSPPPATATINDVTLETEPAYVVAGAAAMAALAVLWLAGSSGSLGAGAAGAAGASGKAAAATDLRRLLPFASPLFTRFEKDTVLGHPKREALYALILQSPGISLQSLGDATGLSRTAVTHHLRLLEHQHLVVSKRMGRSRHYYENGGRFGRDQKEALAVLQNDRSKELATYVKDHPGSIQKTLCAALGLQPSIAHWHLARLQQAQLVESVRNGRTVAYFPGAAMRQTAQPPIPDQVLAAPSVA